MMEQTEVYEMASQLATGFDALQVEYEKLFGQYKSLESKLGTAREQYHELAKLLGRSTNDTTPPRSLISATPICPKIEERPLSVLEILNLRQEATAAQTLQCAIEASHRLRHRMHNRSAPPDGVKIWSGPFADAVTLPTKLPSITESPMERDFTVVGVPSKLGCPFASMSGKKLSSHAASVLSRYGGSHSPRDGQSISRENVSIIASSVSRANARDPMAKEKTRRRSSLIDPIKAEICGMDSHNPGLQDVHSEPHFDMIAANRTTEPGVCPIRFLNQHSPEEIAQYFEKHKHELPRSHEVCVRRYQSNEKQVKELDAKYGDIAQMIKGLGEKHQDLLPKDIEDEDEEELADDVATDGRVEKWADTLSAQAPFDDSASALLETDEDRRESRFERPLRDVRLGESPSRPWGIQVPAQYLEGMESKASSIPAQIKPGAMPADHPPVGPEMAKAGVCPFASMRKQADEEKEVAAVEGSKPVTQQAEVNDATETMRKSASQLPLVFNGPIIIGYGPDEAARFLQSLSLGTTQST